MKKILKFRLMDLTIIVICLIIFGYYNIKSILDCYQIINQPVHGMIVSYDQSKNNLPYFYHTNKGETLNSYYFFENNSELNLEISDYILKYPHSLDLYVLKQGSNGLYRVDRKIIGSLY